MATKPDDNSIGLRGGDSRKLPAPAGAARAHVAAMPGGRQPPNQLLMPQAGPLIAPMRPPHDPVQISTSQVTWKMKSARERTSLTP
jgi:hypothetical protein